jgi:hypothetical protein
MKLDLGCGLHRQEGFIGVDVIDAPGVIKSDILTYLKNLPDNSVDQARMYHSLEHVQMEHYLEVMRNLLRVCKNGAVIEIGMPYYNTGVNMANPYHHVYFNEHSFRFFCREKEDRYQVLPKSEWIATFSFGLWNCANEGELPGYVRIKKIEYIYAPGWSDKAESEKEFARMYYNNVILNMNVTLEVEK